MDDDNKNNLINAIIELRRATGRVCLSLVTIAEEYDIDLATTHLNLTHKDPSKNVHSAVSELIKDTAHSLDKLEALCI